jgi:hypothetical protein
MAEDRTSESTIGRITRAGSDELEASRAAQAGADFEWHFGRVTSLGVYEITNSRTVTILWDERASAPSRPTSQMSNGRFLSWRFWVRGESPS